jgi:glycosyltransferase involved in cell wall biosynthesis
MKSILFSIIIPTLNEEVELPHLLSDLKEQKVKNFEVIIADGSSEDNTKTAATSFAQYYPLHVITTKKHNVSFQRNLGASEAKGKYLIFFDADTRIFPSFADKMEKAIAEKPALLYLPTVMASDHLFQHVLLFKFTNVMAEVMQILGRPFSIGPSIFIEKNLFQHIRGYDEKLFIAEDHNLIVKAHAAGAKITFLKDIHVIFSMRRYKKEGSITVLYKYFIALLYTLVKGGVKEKIFTYNMGGQEYRNMPKNTKKESLSASHQK